MCSNMEDDPNGKEKVTSTRRNNKPLMEKRRRQRINDCLVQLKSLVLQAMNKDSTQYSKLEKADILEMTVKHLKMVQRQQMTVAMATDPNVISKYRAGFNECATEISRYLDTVNGGNPELRTRVMNYLSNSMMQFPIIPVYQGVATPFPVPMTSPSTSTSQHGFNIPPLSHGMPSMFPTQADLRQQIPGSHCHQQQQQNRLQNNCHQQTFTQHQRPQQQLGHHHYHENSSAQSQSSTSFVKSEPLLAFEGHVETATSVMSLMMSHSQSPPRLLPSPCDSDSGLSDSSTSFSHDENGNYHTLNNMHEMEIKNDLDLQRNDVNNVRHQQIPKRKCDRLSPYKTSPKRAYGKEKQICDNKVLVSKQFQAPVENESMWRPW